jgi:hypothetical protein
VPLIPLRRTCHAARLHRLDAQRGDGRSAPTGRGPRILAFGGLIAGLLLSGSVIAQTPAAGPGPAGQGAPPAAAQGTPSTTGQVAPATGQGASGASNPGTPARSASVSQQDRMKSCNAQAKSQSLAGDKRKSFMSACLSGKTPEAEKATTAATAPRTQQDKMKSCNADATSQKLTGNARKTFMSTCLKG